MRLVASRHPAVRIVVDLSAPERLERARLRNLMSRGDQVSRLVERFGCDRDLHDVRRVPVLRATSPHRSADRWKPSRASTHLTSRSWPISTRRLARRISAIGWGMSLNRNGGRSLRSVLYCRRSSERGKAWRRAMMGTGGAYHLISTPFADRICCHRPRAGGESIIRCWGGRFSSFAIADQGAVRRRE